MEAQWPGNSITGSRISRGHILAPAPACVEKFENGLVHLRDASITADKIEESDRRMF